MPDEHGLMTKDEIRKVENDLREAEAELVELNKLPRVVKAREKESVQQLIFTLRKDLHNDSVRKSEIRRRKRQKENFNKEEARLKDESYRKDFPWKGCKVKRKGFIRKQRGVLGNKRTGPKEGYVPQDGTEEDRKENGEET